MEKRLADFGNKAPVKRLTWLIGPPGSGKSTFAWKDQTVFHRIVEFDQLLGPLVNEFKITKGILKANNHLIDVVRDIELDPSNIFLPPILVIAGIIDPEKLFPLSTFEETWVLLPNYDNWLQQIQARPTQKGDMTREEDSEGYKNLAFAKKSYLMMEKWLQTNPPVKRVECNFHEELIGKTYHESIN